jgi:hypothetical protein
MDIEFQLKNDLLRLSGHPCWGVINGYASMLTFEFGQPRLEVREPIPTAKIETLRKFRNVTVRGEYGFWFQACYWDILQDGVHLAHSESESSEIDKAVAGIDGQILEHIKFSTKSPQIELSFDLGGEIQIRSYSDSEPDDSMWSFYVGEFVYTLNSSGLIEYGKGSDRNPESYRLSEFRVNV